MAQARFAAMHQRTLAILEQLAFEGLVEKREVRAREYFEGRTHQYAPPDMTSEETAAAYGLTDAGREWVSEHAD
ncbi:hypothetical protein [Halomarina pelagica]|uniref:hypothetical protein n=1 Tax=Halomarina pelagica TaxID=2961599 RepID=UPI0020C39454|nr:hypothetical protein [Halomarina sp. BND7]